MTLDEEREFVGDFENVSFADIFGYDPRARHWVACSQVVIRLGFVAIWRIANVVSRFPPSGNALYIHLKLFVDDSSTFMYLLIRHDFDLLSLNLKRSAFDFDLLSRGVSP